ncbi:hypothetical protein H5410_026486 [Solanum commersonii]|uniref:Uncharacterized protein n=1 Tax=Solanum commersonii TaxID=4109 RepID=A0A9J5YX71_SOLCO|nr:hypothetical protein H5410_026486 [Solanum commersonii]
MATEKNASSQQQQARDQMLESRPLQITTSTISVGEFTVLPVFSTSTKGNPPSIYEKGGSNDKQSTAKTVITQDNLYPNGKKAKNLQLYFYDHDNELANRMVCSDKVDESIVLELMDILRINPYSFFVQSLIHIPQLHNFHIALKCDSGLDQQLYNLPTSSEIAETWVEKDDNTVSHALHIQIYTHTNKTQIVNYYYGCYDALQYPLLFPYGQNGWHCGIKKNSRPKNVPT